MKHFFFLIFTLLFSNVVLDAQQSGVSPVLNIGDLVIIGAENNSSTSDRIILSNFSDLEPGTVFGLANMVYEAYASPFDRTGKWYSCSDGPNGTLEAIEISYNGSTNLSKGSIICIDLGTASVKINGVSSTDFAISDLNPSKPFGISFSAPESIFLVQGNWDNQSTHYHFDGEVLGGIQLGGTWFNIDENMSSHILPADRRRSRIPASIECLAVPISHPNSTAYSVEYTGPKSGSKRNLLQNLANSNNWICVPQASPNFVSSAFHVNGTVRKGVWTAAEDNDWFNCLNWDNLSVPTAETNVTLHSHYTGRLNGECIIDKNSLNAVKYKNIAECRDLIIGDEERLKVSSAQDSLYVYNNLEILAANNNGLSLGAAGGHVLLAGNWTNHKDRSAFEQGTGSLHLFGENKQVLSTNDAENIELFYNLNINKTNDKLVLKSNLHISSKLDLNKGIINCSAHGNYLRLYADATVAGASDMSYVDGPVQKEVAENTVMQDQFIFPIGKSNTYRPIAIQTLVPAAREIFQAEYIQQPFSDYTMNTEILEHVSNTEYWMLDDLHNIGIETAVKLYWVESSQIQDLSKLRIANFKLPEHFAWDAIPTADNAITGDLIEGSIESSAVSTFGAFTFGMAYDQVIFGSDFISFEALSTDCQTNFNWEVSNATDANEFCIEHSTDGQNFETLSCVNSESERAFGNYEVSNKSSFEGVNYFRVQMDRAGSPIYSEVVSTVTENCNKAKLYPNPVNNQLKVILPEDIQNARLRIMNAQGTVFSPSLNVDHDGDIVLDVESFPHGVYFLHIQDTNGTDYSMRFSKN